MYHRDTFFSLGKRLDNQRTITLVNKKFTEVLFLFLRREIRNIFSLNKFETRGNRAERIANRASEILDVKISKITVAKTALRRIYPLIYLSIYPSIRPFYPSKPNAKDDASSSGWQSRASHRSRRTCFRVRSFLSI